MSQVALPRSKTMTSPGTRRRDETALFADQQSYHQFVSCTDLRQQARASDLLHQVQMLVCALRGLVVVRHRLSGANHWARVQDAKDADALSIRT